MTITNQITTTTTDATVTDATVTDTTVRPHGARYARLFAPLALLVAVAACGGSGANSTDTNDAPGQTAASTDSAVNTLSGSLAERFDAIRVKVTDADGVSCALCMWRADTEDERERGLMQVTDLQGAEGMVFVFDTPTAGGFWMKDTVIPLDVAFYAANGEFIRSHSMEPCASGSSDCQIYRSPEPYSVALEVPAGRASVFGLEPGGRVTLTGPCTPGSFPTSPPTSSPRTPIPESSEP